MIRKWNSHVCYNYATNFKHRWILPDPPTFSGDGHTCTSSGQQAIYFVYRVPWVRNYDYALQLWYGHPKPYLYLSGIIGVVSGLVCYRFKLGPQLFTSLLGAGMSAKWRKIFFPVLTMHVQWNLNLWLFDWHTHTYTHKSRFCFWPHLHSWKLSLRDMALTKMKSLSSLTGMILYLCWVMSQAI